MKNKSILILVVVFWMMAVPNITSAVIIRGINIDFVTIGNPGNSGDTRDAANPYGCGLVDYTYQIGKYEITNGQWDAFVSSAGAPTGNPIDAYDDSAYWTGTNIPTTEVSWYEALQFFNYLTSGDKSQGAYQFSGDNTNPGDFLGIDRDSAVSTYGIIYVLPTEDEWYKAAYYTGSGYSTYANGTDTAPIAGVDTNYDDAIGQPWDVGSGTQEQNGTYDMMGNVSEITETVYGGGSRSHGGCYWKDEDDLSTASPQWFLHLHYDNSYCGFRVASIPEPSTFLLFGLGAIILRRKR